MALSFVGQDLRNRSFRGRKDLAGADFTDADLRGCDFRDTILTDANFTNVITGQSYTKLIIAILSALISSATFASNFAIAFTLSFNDIDISSANFLVAFTVSFLISIISIYSNILYIDVLIFLNSFIIVILLISQSFTAFLGGNIIWGVSNIIFSLSLLVFVKHIFRSLRDNPLNIQSAVGTDFRSANLTGATFANAKLRLVDFTDTKHDLVNWQGAYTYWCKLPYYLNDSKTKYLYLNPEKCRAKNYISANFSKAYLQNADLIDANLLGCLFVGTDLRNSLLVNANLKNSILKDANLSNANLSYTNLQSTMLNNANLNTVDLSYSNLQYSNLKDSDICTANLSNANLKNSSLNNTNLYGANLTNANLQNTNLNNANFQYANLSNANLSNTQVLGTNFTSANLTGACIENWWFSPSTKFDNVTCDYIFLSQKIDENGNIVYNSDSRKPANGNFQQGDFTKLIRQYLDGLDLIFRGDDDPKSFAFALQKLLSEYEDAQIQFGSLQNLGDGDIVLRLTVGNPQVPKSKLQAFFTETKKIAQLFFSQGENQNLQKLESEINRLKKDLADKNRQLESSLVRTKHSPSDNAKVGNNFSLISVIVQDSMFGKKTDIKAGGDVSGVADGNISGVAGKDLKGVAGRDISGQVTITIQELRDSDTPEAPKLADLLTDLQKVISESTELAEPDKEKALKYLDKIGKLANDKECDRDMISMAIDGILNVVSKAAKLLTPVQAIADGLRKILQL